MVVSHVSNFEVGDGKIISNYTQSETPPQITHMAVIYVFPLLQLDCVCV